jgi:bisphosphoglycerate-dependent phosphoglycerate mutase
MENETTKVTATLGYTLNLGNFQSLRVDLGVTDHVRDGETTKDAMDRVYAFVENQVVEKVQQGREALVEE